MRIDAKRPDDTQDFGETRTFYFTARDLAWEFMRVVDEIPGWDAGWPSLQQDRNGYYTVAVRRGGY
jgi:hypothetical protein